MACRITSSDAAPAESARRESVMLCQRFERRMRQCGAFELRIYQGGENEPIQSDGAVPAALQSLDTESRKNYPHVVALNVRAHLNLQISP